MKVQELATALSQQQVAPLYLVAGAELQLQDQARQAFMKILTPEEAAMNFAEFDLEQNDISEAVGEANSLPFFGNKRLIFLTHPYFLQANKPSLKIEQDLNVFIDYLKHPQETTVLVIFAPYDKLDRRKKITKLVEKTAITIDTAKLSYQKTLSTIQQQIKAAGFTITDAALKQLVQRCNNDYTLIISQLAKLYIFAMDQHHITLKAVTSLVPQTLDDNVFDLLNALLKGNLRQAEVHYQQLLLLKNDPIALTALAISQLRLLLQVKILTAQGMTAGKLANYLQVHPYRIKLAIQNEKEFSLAKLKQALTELFEMDYQMKSGQGDKEYLFELFMIRFTQKIGQ